MVVPSWVAVVALPGIVVGLVVMVAGVGFGPMTLVLVGSPTRIVGGPSSLSTCAA